MSDQRCGSGNWRKHHNDGQFHEAHDCDECLSGPLYNLDGTNTYITGMDIRGG